MYKIPDRKVEKSHLAIVCIVCILLILSVSIGHYVTIRWLVHQETRDNLEARSLKLKQSFESIIYESTNVLYSLHAYNTKECSNNVIDKLKLLQFHHYRFQNITLVMDDGYVCSSMLGKKKDNLPSRTADWVTPLQKFWFLVNVNENDLTRYHTIIEQGSYRINLHLQMLFDVPYALPNNELIIEKIYLQQKTIASSHQFDEKTNDHLEVVTYSTLGPFSFSSSKSNSIINDRIYNVYTRTIWLIWGITLIAIWFGIINLKRWYNSFNQRFIIGINNKEITPHFQPIIDSRTGLCKGAEILARWKHKTGNIPPSWFIPKIENSIHELEFTKYIVSLAIKQTFKFLNDNTDMYISFNSSSEVISSAHFFSWLEHIRKSYELKPKQIRLELTERQFINRDAIKKMLQAYRDVGYMIYVDDFGTGYSSLSYLQDLPLDVLKIDKAFIDTIGSDGATSLVTSHIVDMANSLELQVIAEGVEYDYQEAYLNSLGVNLIQGWLYSKELDANSWVKNCASPFYKNS